MHQVLYSFFFPDIKIKIFSKTKIIFFEPYLFPKEKQVFYYYLDKSRVYFEYGSSGGIHQAAKRGLKIYSAEVGPNWVSFLKKEIEKINKAMDKNVNITYLYSDLQKNITPTYNAFKKYVTLYDKQYKADFIYIDGQFHTSCLFHLYDKIDSNTIIMIHDIDKPYFKKTIKKYFKQILKVSRILVFQKKNPAPPLTEESIQKVEKSDFRFGIKFGIESFFVKNFRDLFDRFIKYDNEEMMVRPPRKQVFFFWWQGIDTAPPIIKVCLSAVRRNVGDGTVIVVTKDNFPNLVKIPDYIIEKVNKSLISLTHFSDILRVTLLSKLGGLWIDATIFMKDQISTEIFESPYFTIHFDDTYKYVTGKWTCFCQASYINSVVTKFISELYFEYFKYYDKIFNYFLLDFMMLTGYDFIPSFKRSIQNVPFNNPAVLQLLDHIHDGYSKDYFDYLTKDTTFFKITWKLNLKPYIKGHKTMFGYMAEKYLDNETLNNITVL